MRKKFRLRRSTKDPAFESASGSLNKDIVCIVRNSNQFFPMVSTKPLAETGVAYQGHRQHHFQCTSIASGERRHSPNLSLIITAYLCRRYK